MREGYKHCYECKIENDGLVLLVKSTIINPVYICNKCKERCYPWLKQGQTIPQKVWVNPKLMNKRKEQSNTDVVPITPSKKCPVSEIGHSFDIVRPKYKGMLGRDNQLRSIKEVIENDIEMSKNRKWMNNKVFIYYKCTGCGKDKFEILSVSKAKELAKSL